MTTRGMAVLACASLVGVASCASPASAQNSTAVGSTTAAARQTQQRRPPADDADSQPAAPPGRRTGLKGWFRDQLQTPPEGRPAKSGFSPSVGTVVSGSGLAAGARYRRIDLLPHGIDAEVGAMVSVRAYQEYSAAIGWMDRNQSTVAFDAGDTAVAALFNPDSPKSPGAAAYLDIRHRMYPRHRYYGAGIDTLREDESDYTLSGLSIDAVFQHQFTPMFGVGVRGGWMDLTVGEGHDDAFVDVGDRFAAAGLPGLTRQAAFATLGAGAAWDARNNPRAPEQGWFAAASLRRFTALSAASESFARATFDVRGYRPVPGGTVAVRALTAADLGGSATPFYLQMSLGGPNLLRGFHNYRFTDRALGHISVEYRWRAHRFIEVAPFLDTGTVAGSWGRLDLDGFEASPGIGLRGRTDDRVFGRLDWSRSREGHRITIGIGPAF